MHGQLGPGGKAKGYYYPVRRVTGTTGAPFYTIGAMPSVNDRWRDALVECYGAPGAASDDRAIFYFHAADGPALDRAFRAIAQRVITLRRVS